MGRGMRPGPPPPGGSIMMMKKKSPEEGTRGGVQCDSMDTSESSDDGKRIRHGSLFRSAKVPMDQTSSNTVLDILSCQESNGSFAASAKIATILHSSEDSLKRLSGDLASVWMTYVVIFYLKENHQNEKDVWELVVEKGERWIRNETQAMTQIQKDMAENFMRTLPIK